MPADSDSLYFCVDSDGLMYFKGTSEPTCGTRKFAVVIGPHNRPPVANNDPTSAGDPNYTTLEDAPLTVSAANGVLANDSDPGDTITAVKVSGPSHGTLALNPDGSFSYTPNADFNGTDSFTYKAKDSHGSLSTAATVTIKVSPVNDKPTDISLSPSSVEENLPSGTTVGTLSSDDVDAGDSHTYTLVAGAGDDDNASFKISGSTLQTNAQFDFETKDSYTVRVQTDDGQGGTFEEQLTITITNANDAPTDITLSNASVDENQAAGTDVGTLATTDQDSSDSFTYELVSGTGDDDNASFKISGSTLQTAGPLNFEDGATLSVRVRTSDGHGGTFEEQLTITLGDLNDAPTNLALSNDTVEENQPSGTTVGTLSADDEDGDTPTFAFATGSGDADNGSFTIDGNTLKTNAQFDSETKGSYTILVAADDGQGGTVEKQFTITVTNANDAPTDIELSDSTVAEDVPSGTDVGTFSTTDQDTADTHTYTLVSGTGDDDNASFQISGDTLQTNAEFDFETKNSYTVLVQSDDGQGGTTTKQFTITITNANDTPTDISLSDSTFVEHQPSGTPIGTFSTTDQDAADTFTYSFVTGEGDTDNASFKISGDELQTDADLSAGTYTIRVETDDGNGGTFEKQFDITVVPANFAPTDISLSNNNVAENQPSGTDVGTLSTTDPDSGDTHTYSLVTGEGDTDNASFQISGNTLQTKDTFDFETKDSYTVRVRTDDGHPGGTFEESFTITITNANDAPTDIALSNNTVAENQPSGTDVGTFSTTDQDTADTHTYTLVSGTGSTDNASFQISGNTLKTNAQFDSETKGSYTILVAADDGHGGTTIKQFDITVTNANDAPTDIALSNSSVAENQPSGTDVGTFSTTDQDTADTHTYTLVSGTGSTDNASFQISGNTLKTNAQFNFEVKNSYSIRVQTDDGHGGTTSKQFTITVTNANDVPTNLALSNSSVAENQPSGTNVGTLSTTDEDSANTHTYSLVAGDGDTDNASFQISGNTLQTKAALDFETKNSYTIRLQTSDGQGGTTSKQFTITVTNANDAPTDIALSKSDVNENLPSGTPVGTFSTTDQDAADTHTYTLVSGTGDDDNASFQIVGGELRTNASFNFEAKNSYSVRVRTTDNGTPAQFFEESFTISINDANDAPVAGTDSYSGAIGNTKASSGVTVTGEPVVTLSANVPTGNVLKANDSDEDATLPHTLSAVQETVSSTGGGTATINSDGSFTFVPGVGDKNQSDTFTYHVTDGQATSSGTVTVGIVDKLVWYVDNSKATNGDGRSSSPLNSLTGINGAGGSGDSDGPSDILFLYQGSGNYTGGLPLEASQQLIGQPNGLTVNNVSLVSPSGTRPQITNASGNGITLGTGNTIRSVNVGTSSGSGILGNAFGTLDVGSVGVNTTGQALSLTTGTLTGSLGNVSSSGGTNNVLLSGVGTSGGIDLGTGSLSGATSDAFKVVGGTGSFSYAGGILQANNAPLVGVSGGHTGTLAFSTGTLSATGGTGLQFDNADGTYSFGGTTTLNGGDAGIDILNGSTGTFNFGTGTAITNPSGTAFNLSGATASNANVTYSGSISKNNSGFAVDIDNHDSGTVTFQTGTLSSTGTSSGVRVANSNGGQVNFNNPTKTLNTATNKAVTLDTNNAGGTVSFGNGGLDIDTTSGGGFSATGDGTVTVGTGGNPNTIDSTTGTALNVSNTTIGSNGLTFRSISANGGTNGIVLNTTGSSGGLTVTGTTSGSCGGVANPGGLTGTTPDTADCTGGRIQNMSGTDGTNAGIGILLIDTDKVSLTRMRINNNQNFGIKGTDVAGFVLASAYAHNNGNSVAGDGEGNVYFYGLVGGSGANSITNSYLDLGAARNLHVLNTSGTLDRLTVSGTTIGNDGFSGSDGIFLQADNSANTSVGVTLKATVQNSRFNGSRGDGIQLSARGTSVTDLTFTGNRMTNNHPNQVSGSTAVTISGGGSAGSFNPTNTFNISNNVINNNSANNASGTAIAVGKGGISASGSFTGTISGNTIGTAGVANSGSAQGSGIGVDIVGGGVMNAAITNNVIRQFTNNGILVQSGDVLGGGGTGNMIADIRGNTVAEPSPSSATVQFPTNGIRVVAGTNSGDNTKNCITIGGTAAADKNSISGTGTNGATDLRVFQRFQTILAIPGYAGAANDNAAMNAYLTARNTLSTVNATNNTTANPAGPGFSGTCSTP